MPILKSPCSNCPFRKDEKAIDLNHGRLEGIVADLLSDDSHNFVCHKTLSTERKTCSGALAFMHKLGRLPISGRLGIMFGVVDEHDLKRAEGIVKDREDLDWSLINLEQIRDGSSRTNVE